jgi:adenylate cyclase
MRRLSAVAFADVVGYSILMAEDEDGTHRRWMAILADVIRPLAARHGGTIIKLAGDGLLAEFPSAWDAVEWACAVQIALLPQGSKADEPPIRLRIAVHLGDVIVADGDLYGDGINIAARLQEQADPGGIVLSEAVHDLVHTKAGLSLRDLGYVDLKNIGRPIRAFALDVPGASAAPLRLRRQTLPSIAVLPLQNLGGDPNGDYFSDGVVEDIIVSLASLGELFVISRASTLIYRGRQPDPREVGRALGVRYVLVGSVRRSERLIRVSTQLCDARSGVSLWGDRSEVAPGDLFDVQDKIVRKIVAGIAPQVRTAELSEALRKRPENFSAYDCTLRALGLINTLDREAFVQARRFLDKAMAEDPDFAMPVAWSARWHSLNIGQGWSAEPAEDARLAAERAARAIELDGHNSLALATYGHIRSFLFHDYDSALVYFDRALAACPNNSLAWILSGGTLAYVGRGMEAVSHAEHGLSLSPFDQSLFYYYMFLGLTHYANGSYEEAARWGRMSDSHNPSYTANLRILAAALAALGRTEEARAIASRLLTLEPGFDLNRYWQTRQPFRADEIRSRYWEHLRSTGLPE